MSDPLESAFNNPGGGDENKESEELAKDLRKWAALLGNFYEDLKMAKLPDHVAEEVIITVAENYISPWSNELLDEDDD